MFSSQIPQILTNPTAAEKWTTHNWTPCLPSLLFTSTSYPEPANAWGFLCDVCNCFCLVHVPCTLSSDAFSRRTTSRFCPRQLPIHHNRIQKMVHRMLFITFGDLVVSQSSPIMMKWKFSATGNVIFRTGVTHSWCLQNTIGSSSPGATIFSIFSTPHGRFIPWPWEGENRGL